MSTLDERIAARPAPKVTPHDVQDAFVSAQYHQFSGTTVTVCCATMRNGFVIVGSAACAEPANFDEAIGRELALKDCQRKAWPVLGYALRERLSKREVS